MGNCSLRAVTDATNEEGAVRTGSPTSVEVLPQRGDGVWKVKLVIDPKDLERILSEEVNTGALIEQMRIAANSTSAPTRGKASCSGRSERFVC